ncbi:MAG TPA: hypothetical protein PKC65_03110 [Pyrinomonadaceae bacterium]|nr:hypothetical protein [Pyrinomonadaceae bacterium]HMM78993.1 hypothetical protein [Pyrinomonadaceae bacterium]
MPNLESAIQIKRRANAAIAELDAIVSDLGGQVAEEEMLAIRKSVGSSIGIIINQVLEPIFRQYPEIDDDI